MTPAGDASGPRVAMVVGQFWPLVAGTENQARRLAAELARQGVAVEVLTRRLEAEWPRVETVNGVTVRRLGYAGRRMRVRRIERAHFMAALAAHLGRERGRYDLVHVHQVLYPAAVAAAVAHALGKPSLARLAGTGASSDLSGPEACGPLLAWLARRSLTRIVAPSAEAERECLAHGYEATRIVRIPNGVEVGPPAARRGPPGPPGSLRVAYVGTLRRVKRVDVLVEGWRLAGCPGRLVMVGDGPERAALEAAARGCGATVEFRGALPDPAAALREADVFALTSDGEGMSNALLEAMAQGCAIVATAVGGNLDALADVPLRPTAGGFSEAPGGWLVPTGDAAAVASAFRALAGDPARVVALGRAAYERCADRFSLATVARRYRALYAELLASNSS